jgi:hypothetical protein
MSGGARAPPPAAAGGLPSLGLLSLKEAPVAAKASVYELGLQGDELKEAPVAAKASAPVYELELEGEEDGWDSIDVEDVSTGRLYRGDGREAEKIELWEEKYEDTPAKEVPFIWKNICDIFEKKVSNRAWLAVYGKKGYTPEELATASLDSGHKWKGWSMFSPAYEKLAPGEKRLEDDSANPELRKANAADVYYTKAHYMVDADADPNLQALIASDRNLRKAFLGGYPEGDADAMVDTHCTPLFQWILDYAILGDVAEHDEKTKEQIVETFKTELRKLLKAKAALAILNQGGGGKADIEAEEKKIEAAVDELTDVYDDFKARGGKENPCPLPHGCLVHEHLRFGGTVFAVKGKTFAEKKYVGVRYDDWGTSKAAAPPGSGEMYRFYATGSPIQAWFVFLGVSASASTLETGHRLKNKEGTPRYQRAQIVKQRRQTGQVKRRQEREKREEERKDRKQARDAEVEKKREEAEKNKIATEEQYSLLKAMLDDYERMKAQKQLDGGPNPSGGAGPSSAGSSAVTDEEVRKWIDDMVRAKNNPANEWYEDYEDYYKGNVGEDEKTITPEGLVQLKRVLLIRKKRAAALAAL